VSRADFQRASSLSQPQQLEKNAIKSGTHPLFLSLLFTVLRPSHSLHPSTMKFSLAVASIAAVAVAANSSNSSNSTSSHSSSSSHNGVASNGFSYGAAGAAVAAAALFF
jgi:uncharacterized membrane protein YgcG